MQKPLPVTVVDSWFWPSGNNPGWISRFMTLNYRTDWPDVVDKRAFWDNFRVQFNAHGVREDEADEAAGVVAGLGSLFIPDYLGHLLDAAKRIKAEKSQLSPEEGTFANAKEVSKECPECHGDGWASRNYVVPSHGGSNEYRGALACRCPAGRSILKTFGELKGSKNEGAELYRQIDDLQAHPKLWTHESRLFSDVAMSGGTGNDESFWVTL